MAHQAYINSGINKVFKLKDFASECGDNFPVVVTVLSPEYELMFGNYLPPDEDVLLIKPKEIQFVRVKILPFFNENEVIETKGQEFVQARNNFTGREFLLPREYSGKLQVVKKLGRRNRLTSMSQVIDDKPSYIQICQTMQCESPIDDSVQTIHQGAILEIIAVKTLQHGNGRYIECKSSDNKSFYLTEDCLINGKALHCMSTIVEHTAILPETVIFEPIDPNDVLLSDDDEANDMLVLMGGPVSILSATSRNVYVAWMKTEEFSEKRKLAVIPEEVWSSIHVKLLHFSGDVDRIEYMRINFGCHFGAEFIVGSLYKMLPTENGVALLSEPRVDNIDDYEEPIPAIPPRPEKNNPVEDKEEILLPTQVKAMKKPRFTVKFSLGHKQKPSREITHELFKLPNKPDKTTQSKNSNDSNVYLKNTEQPGAIFWNLAGHAKETKRTQPVRPIIAIPPLPIDTHKNTNTLKNLADIDKICRPDQTEEDFYKYTCDEVVECFKLCGLDSLAEDCSSHNLDGAYFRNISPTDLQTDFKLEPIALHKVKNAIKHGWRPKL